MMLYRLSKLIPVRMRSTYFAGGDDDAEWAKERASWWQWRGHIFRHRVTRLA
jgi:hypothetical protein